MPFFVQSLLVRRSLLEELDGFDEAMVIGEDVDLIFRLALKTRFCFVSAPLVRIDQTTSRPCLTELYSRRAIKYMPAQYTDTASGSLFRS